jgi:hypothetical protein
MLSSPGRWVENRRISRQISIGTLAVAGGIAADFIVECTWCLLRNVFGLDLLAYGCLTTDGKKVDGSARDLPSLSILR